MKKRFITGFLLCLTFIPLILFDGTIPIIIFECIFGILNLIATYEILKAFKEKNYKLSIKILTMILSLGIYFGSSLGWIIRPNICDLISPYLIIIPITFFIFSLILYNSLSIKQKVSPIISAIFYPSLGFGAISLLKKINNPALIIMFITVACTDMFAYFGGNLFGKRKLAPIISPNKTVEGSVIGSLFATIIASVFCIFYGKIFNPVNPSSKYFNIPKVNHTIFDNIMGSNNINIGIVLISIISVIFITIIAQIGDLFASKIKRTQEIKDFGYLFPGHGGVIDRFDSSLFSANFMLILIYILLL